MTILDTIIAQKIRDVEVQKRLFSVNQLEKRKGFLREPVSLRKSLIRNGSSGIISEFKRQSPSKGIINNKARVEDVTLAYSDAGVSGISILTDHQFFGGSPVDIIAVREGIHIPILRKDFMVDEYQVIEAKAMGADVILLIAAVLDLPLIKKLATCAKSLGLEILFEIHAREELDKIIDEVDMVGVNNRNLKDFKVDLQHSIALSKLLPDKFVKVSESGIDNVDTIKMLKREGFQGFLIGENFMKTENPGEACREFIKELASPLNPPKGDFSSVY